MTAATTPRQTTEPFREEHLAIKEHLRHMSQMIESIPGAAPEVRKQNMTGLVEALKEHILLHAEWEEKVLYPVIDKKAGGGKYAFTAAMRHEHRIVGRWIDELALESEKGTPDATLFVHRADQLLGLILAHFEDEEEVLLPVLDELMTPEEFEREISSQGHPHGH
ncbi:MAG: hemerythrin domain-containing protein [Thermoanaerobaculia bacterium]|jgi:hemerythrin-like domain-containing protein